jgi:O-antigen ligase
VLLLLMLPFQSDIMMRLLGSDEGSAEGRIPLIKIALHIIADHPLLGAGVNNYAVVMPQYITPEFSRDWLYVVHNKYLLVWSETGIGGIAAFLAFLIATLRRAWRCWELGDRVLAPLALGLAAGLAGHMFHMLVDVFHSRPLGQLLWLLMGVVTAMFNLVHGRAEHAENPVV